MATSRQIGNSPDDFACCEWIIVEALHDGVRQFRTLPASVFTPEATYRREAAERAMEDTARRGDWVTLLELADDYRARVERFCARFQTREKVTI